MSLTLGRQASMSLADLSIRSSWSDLGRVMTFTKGRRAVVATNLVDAINRFSGLLASILR